MKNKEQETERKVILKYLNTHYDVGETKDYMQRPVNYNLFLELPVMQRQLIQEIIKLTFEETKQEFIEDEIKFLNKLKKEFLILDDKIKEGMEDGQISILKRLRRLEKSLGGKNETTKIKKINL